VVAEATVVTVLLEVIVEVLDPLDHMVHLEMQEALTIAKTLEIMALLDLQVTVLHQELQVMR
jgi:hypothetical protein